MPKAKQAFAQLSLGILLAASTTGFPVSTLSEAGTASVTALRTQGCRSLLVATSEKGGSKTSAASLPIARRPGPQTNGGHGADVGSWLPLTSACSDRLTPGRPARAKGT